MSHPPQRLVTVTSMPPSPTAALPSPASSNPSSASSPSSAAATKRSVGAYIVTKRLGNGSFATVWRGYHRNTLQPVAIKSISLAKLASNRKHVANLESEIECMRALQHENVVRLIETHDSERHKYLIMEFCEGGDLSHFLRKHKQPLPLPLAQRFAIQLKCGLQVLHSRQLIHRDLKPQNLLLDQSTSPYTATLKLADFGFARSLLADDMAATLCGSPLYMAPEILKYQAYDAKADLWSVGAILYEMVVGRVPYTGQNHIQLLDRIEREEVSWPAAVEVSADCKDLIGRLLKRKVDERMSFQEFFNHPFLQEKGTVQRNNRPGPEEQLSAKAVGEEATVAGVSGVVASPLSMRVSATLYDKSQHGSPSVRNSQQPAALISTVPLSANAADSPASTDATAAEQHRLDDGDGEQADTQQVDSPERSRIALNASPPVDIPQPSASHRSGYVTSPLILPPSSSPPPASSPFFSSSPPSPSPVLAASSTGRRPSSSLSLRKDSGSMAGSGSGSGTERNKASGSIDKEYEMVDQVPQSFQPDSPSSTTQPPLPLAHTSPSLLSTFVSASQRLVAHVAPVFVSSPSSPSSAALTPVSAASAAKFSPSLHSIADVPYKCIESDDELSGLTLSQLVASMRRLKEEMRKANAVAKAARFCREQATAEMVAGGFMERVMGAVNGSNASLHACAVGLWVRALSVLHACMDEMEAFYEQLVSVQGGLPLPLSDDARDLEEQWHDKYCQLRDAILVYSGEAQETAKELADERERQRPTITTFEIGAQKPTTTPTAAVNAPPLSSSAFSSASSMSSPASSLTNLPAPSAPVTFTTAARPSPTGPSSSNGGGEYVECVVVLWQCVLSWCDEALTLEGADDWRGSLRLYEQSLSLASHMLDEVSAGSRDEDVLLACLEQLEARIRAVSRELHAGRRRRESTVGSASGLNERSSSSLLQASNERRDIHVAAVH